MEDLFDQFYFRHCVRYWLVNYLVESTSFVEVFIHFMRRVFQQAIH